MSFIPQSLGAGFSEETVHRESVVSVPRAETAAAGWSSSLVAGFSVGEAVDEEVAGEEAGLAVDDAEAETAKAVASDRRVSKRVYFPTRIVGIQVAPLSDDQKRKLAVVSITDARLTAEGRPRPNGALDTRMGSSERRVRCATCDQTDACPGHPGIIHFPVPLYNVLFLTHIINALSVFCGWCAHPVIDPQCNAVREMKKTHWERLSEVAKKCKSRTSCFACSLPHPKYHKTGVGISRNWPKSALTKLKEERGAEAVMEATAPFTAAHAKRLFAAVSAEDWLFVGIDARRVRMEDTIMCNMLVPPPCVRPGGNDPRNRGHDDLTVQIQNIVKCSQALRAIVSYEVLQPAMPANATEADSTGIIQRKKRRKRAASSLAAAASALAEAQKKEEHIKQALRMGRDEVVQTSYITEWEYIHGVTHAVTMPASDSLDEMICADARLCAKISVSYAKEMETLQAHVGAFMSNNGKWGMIAKQRSGQKMKSIADRLKDKFGRIRSNLQGKRVNNSARCVISPDPFMELDEVGVPEAVATVLVTMEIVNAQNRARLEAAVRRGPHVLGGATEILCPQNVTIFLSFCTDRESIELQDGWRVHRHIVDGDPVLMNRQPSLHHASIQAFRVKVVKGYTFRLNLGVVTPFNADFDGDEMNLHVPYSEITRQECMAIMSVQECILSQQKNGPCMGLVQDSLFAGRLMTRREVWMEEEEFLRVTQRVRDARNVTSERQLPPAMLFPRRLWTGKQVMSMCLPQHFRMEAFVRGAPKNVIESSMSMDENYVCIVRGQLLCGSLGKEMLGAAHGGLVHVICKEHGGGRARDFVTFAQWVSSEWLCEKGYSVGMFDCVLPESAQSKIATTLRTDLARISDLAERARVLQQQHSGSLISQQISQAISSCVELASMKAHRATKRFVDAMGMQNPLNATILSGSKGTDANMFQIMTCLGQQYFEGSHIGCMVGVERPLPCFEPGDARAHVRGMITRDFGHGISPSEYFFHAVSSREGLVNTSIKTSTTGYTQRRLIKGMEDLRTFDDCSVRGAHGKITQFIFGGDGRDPSRLIRAHIFLSELCEQDPSAIERMKASFTCPHQAAYAIDVLRPHVARVHVADWSVRAMDETMQMPIDCVRMWAEKGQCASYSSTFAKSKQRLAHTFSPEELLERFSQLLDDSLLEWCALWVSRGASTREVLFQWLAYVLHESEYSRIPAGEMVGIRCAQSVCEPTTQMTLNTFHRSGAKHAITEGVPRFNEIISASWDTKTPFMYIPVLREPNKKHRTPQDIARKVRRVMLSRVTRSSFVIYDPPCAAPEDTCVPKDAVLLRQLELCSGGMSERDAATQFFSAPVSDFLIRIECDPELMRELDLAPDAFVHSVESLCDCPLMFVISDETASRWVMRIRLVGQVSQEAAKAAHASITRSAYANGLRGIKHAVAVKKTVFRRTGPPVEMDFIETSGSSLMSVSGQPWADFLHTYSNDVQEVASELGIEAANRVIYEELNKIIRTEYASIDPRHLQMLADAITRSGFVMPMTRHGINRRDTPISTRISFEELMESLCNAAIVGEKDILETPSGSIMVGERTCCGTGAIAIDFSAMRDSFKPAVAASAHLKDDLHRQKNLLMAAMATMRAPEDIERSKMRAIEAHRTTYKHAPERTRYVETKITPVADLYEHVKRMLESPAMDTSVRIEEWRLDSVIAPSVQDVLGGL